MKITIIWPAGNCTGWLNDSSTAQSIIAALPVDSRANTWGEEVYFEIPVSAEADADARTVVDAGDICFWPPGHAIAIAFGPTPISTGDECRLASPCNVLGRIDGDPRVLASVQSGDAISMCLID